MKKLFLLFLIPFLSTPLLAEGFNDNYFQLGYSTSNYKFVDKIMDIKGSAEIGNGFSILGSYVRETGDWRDPGEYETSTYTTITIGIGKTFEVDTNTNITSSLSYLDYDLKQTRQADGSSTITNSSADTTAYIASLGVRNISESGIESSIKFIRQGGGKSNSYSNELEIEIMKHFNETIAIGGRVLRRDNPPSSSHESDFTETGIFVRRSF